MKRAERERHVHAAQVVLAGALDHDFPGLGTLPARLGYRDDLPAGEVGAGQRVRAVQQFLQRPGDNDVAAVLARPGPDVHHPVGGADGVLVVLDHDQRVAEVAEPDQRLEQPAVVALVQPDRRLVEHVEHADQAGADLRGQPDPLCLPAGQRRRCPVQRQVVKPHIQQEAQPGGHLSQDGARDLLIPLGQPQRWQSRGQLPDRQRAQFRDGPAVDGHREGYRLQPGPAAGRAGDLAHETREPVVACLILAVVMLSLDVGDRALEAGVVGALPPVPGCVLNMNLLVMSVQQSMLGGGGQPGPGRVDAEPERVAERLDQPHEVVVDVPAAPHVDRALGEGLAGIRHHELRVDLHPRAQASAVGTGAPG